MYQMIFEVQKNQKPPGKSYLSVKSSDLKPRYSIRFPSALVDLPARGEKRSPAHGLASSFDGIVFQGGLTSSHAHHATENTVNYLVVHPT